MTVKETSRVIVSHWSAIAAPVSTAPTRYAPANATSMPSVCMITLAIRTFCRGSRYVPSRRSMTRTFRNTRPTGRL